MELGRVGIWTHSFDMVPVAAAQAAAAEVESMGFQTVWMPEAVGREAFTNAMMVLGGTTTLQYATGIASIYGRDALTAASAQKTIESTFPGRFLLGLGVSHQPMVESIRGHNYAKPYSAMKSYLDAMDNALFLADPPATSTSRVLAALGPKMLQMAAERALGAHPYFVPVEHTPLAREALGADPLLAPEQAVVFSTDPTEARSIARQHMSMYLQLPNYTNNLRRLGWGDHDLGNGGSDKLVDAIVAWGDEDVIAARVKAHHDAGADHVAVQVLTADQPTIPMEQWRRLADALL